MDQLDKLRINKENYMSFTLDELENIVSKILSTITSLDENKIDVFYKCVHQLYMLNSEILNGGFNQYFINQEDQYDYAILGLTMINANQNRDVLKKAFDKYDELYSISEVPEMIDLSDFDNSWEDIEGFYEKRLGFIVENIDRFFYKTISKQFAGSKA